MLMIVAPFYINRAVAELLARPVGGLLSSRMFRCELLICMLLWSAGGPAANHCTSPRSSAFKFSITSRRNSTGHWIAEVKLEHNAEGKEVGPWEVDVDHVTSKCDNSDLITIAATIAAPSSISKPPAAGYDLVPGLGYYKLHTDVKTWHEALRACEQEGAHLVIINSEAEAKALTPFWDMNPKILNGAPNDWAHAGFHDLYKEGEYLTIFNQTLVGAGYVKWYPGDPHGVNQNCGLVIRRDNLLADIPCNEKQPFFCEKEL
ncbi:hemolymph lipopolysaccharide-binding protein-like [Periplaneta americana]|uniref:hemolymph lipopolysaccharide-binding protein-like n=1 Tax=Periplaneta americana TaxID=6978 RepID=UPI0037E96F24